MNPNITIEGTETLNKEQLADVQLFVDLFNTSNFDARFDPDATASIFATLGRIGTLVSSRVIPIAA